MKTIKCKAGDYFVTPSGKNRYITDDEKVAQDIASAILTEIATKMRSTGNQLTKSNFQIMIHEAVAKVQTAQDTFPDISPREKIRDITKFFTVTDPDDPTSLFFYVEIQTEAGDQASFVFDDKTYTDLSHLLPSRVISGINSF